MTLKLLDNVGATATRKATPTRYDLDAVAVTDFWVTTRTFAEAVTDGDLVSLDEVICTVKKDATNWETIRAVYTDAATDTLGAFTVLASDGTIATDDVVDVVCTGSGVLLTPAVLTPHISGIVPSWTDTNTVAWSAGRAVVDGEMLVYAGGNSGNIGQSSDGLSATGVWLHWLYDNAGTPAIEMKQAASGAETWDTDKLYWRKGSDTTRRLIGWHHCTDDSGTRLVDHFSCQTFGNILEHKNPIPQLPSTNTADYAAVRLVSSTGNVGDVAYTSISNIANLLPAVCTDAWVAAKLQAGASNSDGIISISPESLTGDYGTFAGKEGVAQFTVRSNIITNGKAVFFGRTWAHMLTPNTLFWALDHQAGTLTVIIEFLGGRMVR